MTHKKLVFLIIAFLCLYSGIQANVYTKPNYLINNPAAHRLDAGELDFILGYGVQVASSNAISLATYYTFNKQLQVGLSFLNGSDLNLNMHTNFYDYSYKNHFLTLGGGFLSIPNSIESGKRIASYVVAKTSLYDVVDIHTGFGSKLHEEQDFSFYYGITFKYYELTPTLEYDGKGVNASVGIDLKPNTKIVAGLVNMGDEELRSIYVGLHHKWFLFKELNTKVSRLESDIEALSVQKNDIKYQTIYVEKKSEKDVIRSNEERERRQRAILSSKIGEFIRKKEFNKAISSLNQSLGFNPDDLEMRLLLANIHYIKGDKDLFKQEIQAIIKRDAYYDGLWELSPQAFDLVRNDIYDELKIDASYFDAIIVYIRKYVIAVNQRALQYDKAGNVDLAKKYKRMLMMLDPFEVK
jgi:hypothetical protein